MVEIPSGWTDATIKPYVPRPSPETDEHGVSLYEGPPDGAKSVFRFSDLLDILNPIQHIPVVGSVYRKITGDEMTNGARLAGDVLYTGPFGLVSAAVNIGLQESTGKDAGEHVLTALFPDQKETGVAAKEGNPIVVAMAETASPDEVQLQAASANPTVVPTAPPAPAKIIATIPAGPTAAAASEPTTINGRKFFPVDHSRTMAPGPVLRASAPSSSAAAAKSDVIDTNSIPTLSPEMIAQMFGQMGAPQPASADGSSLMPAQATTGGMADQMMMSLDKYQSLLKARQAGTKDAAPIPQ